MPSLTVVTEGTSTLNALAEEIGPHILSPSSTTYPGVDTIPGDLIVGLDALSEATVTLTALSED